MGDSITFGHGVEEGESYPARLADILSSGGRFEVVNVSDLGTRSADLAWHLEERALPLHPHRGLRHVLHCFCQQEAQ